MRSLVALAVVAVACTGCTTTEQQMAGGAGGFMFGGPVGAAAGYATVTAYQCQQKDTQQDNAMGSIYNRIERWEAENKADHSGVPDEQSKARHGDSIRSNWLPDGKGGV
jgi:hypothetical protein